MAEWVALRAVVPLIHGWNGSFQVGEIVGKYIAHLPTLDKAIETITTFERQALASLIDYTDMLLLTPSEELSRWLVENRIEKLDVEHIADELEQQLEEGIPTELDRTKLKLVQGRADAHDRDT